MSVWDSTQTTKTLYGLRKDGKSYLAINFYLSPANYLAWCKLVLEACSCLKNDCKVLINVTHLTFSISHYRPSNGIFFSSPL